MKIENRFIKYVKFDTQSSEASTTAPSTQKQFDLANALVEELTALHLTNIELTKEGLIYATCKGNDKLPPIGLIAHMDTALELPSGNFEPRVIEKYQGEDIRLNDTYTMSPKDYPSLKHHKGHTLIVTDGDHLLGGDDKAGIAIIMTLLEYYSKHPEINHAPIKVCFTPDEEVGRGTENFSVEKMGAKIAYTLDGGNYKEINYENFNAASAIVDIKGVSVHPGSAKGIMINAILLGYEFNSMLPKNMIPSKTSGYQGFNHLLGIEGTAEEVKMSYIIRNHDENKLEEQLNIFKTIQKTLQAKYPKAIINVTLKHSYKNMRTYFDKDMSAIEKVQNAYKKLGIKPVFNPIRGGTDGANITFMGLPCPNLGTGDYNCHGRFEYVSVNEMKKMVKVLRALLED